MCRAHGTGLRAGVLRVLGRRLDAPYAAQENVAERPPELAADRRIKHEIDGRIDDDEQVEDVVKYVDGVRRHRVDGRHRVHDGLR